MDIDFLGLLFRWMHILAAITAVGGTIFARFALLPAAATLADEPRKALLEGIRARWAKFVMGAILFLLASGFYNFIRIVTEYDVPRPTYHMLFGIKFLLAIAIFLIASLLTGRKAAAQRIRQNAKFWMSLNVGLAVVLVCISGVLRALPHNPKPDAAAKATAAPAFEAPVK